MPSEIEIALVCEECGVESKASARGWRPLLTVDDEIATYCPDCARKGFGKPADQRGSVYPTSTGFGIQWRDEHGTRRRNPASRAAAKHDAGTRTSSGSGCGAKPPPRHR